MERKRIPGGYLVTTLVRRGGDFSETRIRGGKTDDGSDA